MNKMLIAMVVLAVLSVSVVLSAAQVVVQARPRIGTLIVIGKGIAISKDNPMDFELVKISAGRVVARLRGRVVSALGGILYMGADKYRIRNITYSNGTFSGVIYSAGSPVGAISLDSYIKGNSEVWAGDLVIEENGTQRYNVYIIGYKRRLKPVEFANKIKEYCKDNPRKCKAAIKGVGRELCDDPSLEGCREKIKNFCERHPNDRRCIALKNAYCSVRTDDVRCREELKEYCKKNPDEKVCERLVRAYPKIIKIKERVKRVIKERMPAWLRRVRGRVINVTRRLQTRRSGW
ncbi:MAG: hypothetical protein DRP03_00420 [Candidatus Aenigmatarchaeota archaeon]|nr:MAG: hypothetical protein DRP03_00420 [Candidatus Aenigmarchaeota archaeon]